MARRKKRRLSSSKRARAWRKLVKKYGVAGAARMRHKRGRKQARVGRNPRQMRRATRRNYWKDDRKGHRRASRKGWRRRKRMSARRYASWSRRVAANPGLALANPPQHRRYHRNPGFSLADITSTFKEIFSVDTLKDGAYVAGGAVAAPLIADLVVNKLLKQPQLREGWSGKATNVGAGALAVALYGMLTGDRRGAKLALLGVVGSEIGKLASEYLMPPVRKALGMGQDDIRSALKDAILQEAAKELEGMSDYAGPEAVLTARDLGDALTPQQVVTARSLDEWQGDDY